MNRSSSNSARYLSAKMLSVAGLVLALAPGTSGTANAQQYPVKPIRMLIQFSPGGAPDLIARSLGQKLTESWGQQVVVDSRPGAGGNIALEICARAAPDGYTLAVVSPTIVINPALYRNISWSPSRDFTAITLAGTLPNMLLVHPSLPVRSVKDLIALAKAKPDQLNYSTSGVGTSTHLAAELFQHLAGVKFVHVTYKGGAPAMTAAVAGEVPMTFNSASALSQVRAGKLIALGMTTAKRWDGLPNVPTIAETLPGYEVVNWFGVVGPAGMDSTMVARLNKEMVRILRLPEVKDRLEAQSIIVNATTPQEFQTYMAVEGGKWAKLIKAAGIRID